MTTADNLLDTSTTAMVTALKIDALETWSDQRRTDFAKTFSDRGKAAQFILVTAATMILEKATSRHIAGHNAADIANKDLSSNIDHLYDPSTDGTRNSYHHRSNTVGGRSIDDLRKIAESRADAVLSELPAVKKAMAILQPDVAKMMDERDALQKKGQVQLDKLNALSEVVALADMDQNMTIAAFRAFVKDREKKRRALVTELNEIGEEGNKLEEIINKKLFKGIPGLHESVIKVARTHLERAKAFDEMGRRVTEKVMFGDSAAATELLKHFEADEVEISASVKADLKAAVAKLMGSGAPKAPAKKAPAKLKGK